MSEKRNSKRTKINADDDDSNKITHNESETIPVLPVETEAEAMQVLETVAHKADGATVEVVVETLAPTSDPFEGKNEGPMLKSFRLLT